MTTELEGGDALQTDQDGVVLDNSGIHHIPGEELPQKTQVFSSALSTAPLPLVTVKSNGLHPEDDVTRIAKELAEIKAEMGSRELSDVIRETLGDNTTTHKTDDSKLSVPDFDDINATRIIDIRWDWENLTRLNPTEGKPFQDYPALIHAWDKTKKRAGVDWSTFGRNIGAKFSPLDIQVFQDYQLLLQYLLRVRAVLDKKLTNEAALRQIRVLEKQYRWGLDYIEKRNLARANSAQRIIYSRVGDTALLSHPDLRNIIFNDAFNSVIAMVKDVLEYEPNPGLQEFPTVVAIDVSDEMNVVSELIKSFIKMNGSLQLYWAHEKRNAPFPQLFAEKMKRFFELLGQKYL